MVVVVIIIIIVVVVVVVVVVSIQKLFERFLLKTLDTVR